MPQLIPFYFFNQISYNSNNNPIAHKYLTHGTFLELKIGFIFTLKLKRKGRVD